jgi:hypothetical protein
MRERTVTMRRCARPHSGLRLAALARSAQIATMIFGIWCCGPAGAATLVVGKGQPYRTPAEAAKAARAGDTVRIEAGDYRSCAVWLADNLTIWGLGSGPRLTGTLCQGKAIFVVRGSGVTIQNVTFEGARSADGNGAGIRAEGNSLAVDHSVFRDNQDGILTDDDPRQVLVVRNSSFEGNGACAAGGCAHAIYAGHIALLRVERSRFIGTRLGHCIKSRARRTEITGDRIMDGAGGTASYLVDIPNGGTLIMTGNVLEKGPKSENHLTAISIGEEGELQPTEEILIRDNVFSNDGPPSIFVRNSAPAFAQLAGNTIKGNAVTPLVGSGTVR